MSTRPLRRETSSSQPVPEIRVWSADFSDNGPMPRKHTCQGDESSPELSWEPGPEGTESYCLIVTDPDAPIPLVTITHWILYNIPATVTSVPGGVTPEQLSTAGIAAGRGIAGRYRYVGPCPPSGTHRYVFDIYALDTRIDLVPRRATRGRVMKATEGHIIGTGRIVGLYSRR